MRDAFVRQLFAEALDNPAITLLTGDLGFGVLDTFARDLPGQFLNVGVAEQNMIGVAAGLASTGRRVFVYSIANFPTFRCLEQIRNDIVYHQLDVTVVSVGAGVSYGTLGYTHHALEDIAIMRALPNFDILCPADPLETVALTRSLARSGGPAYLRLGKNGEPNVHEEEPSNPRQAAQLIRAGADATLLATGAIITVALAAADALWAEHGVDVAVWSVPSISPLDPAMLSVAIASPAIVTIEEHRPMGGFGSAVLEALAEVDQCPPMRVVAANSATHVPVGSASYLLECYGITAQAVVEKTLSAIRPGETGR